MYNNDFDIAIVGAGPAGCSCELMLAETGLNIAVIDKAAFPRDKICGDALSGNVISTLKRLPDNIYNKFLTEFPQKLPSYGIKFIAPNLNHIDIPFNNSSEASGYISRRIDFDNFLFRQLKNYPNIKTFESCRIEDIEINNEHAILKSASASFQAKVIVAADGANSVIAKYAGKEKSSNNCTGLRTYYQNVSGFDKENFIELFFLKDILPGYFWIFPLPDNKANVGIGMLTSHINRKKINLKALMLELINNHPVISQRFKGTELIDDVKAYSLPLANEKKSISGKRILLTGDAASLVDHFTGEGIGNAMLSGRVAAEQIKECIQKNDFSAELIKSYDVKLYNKIWDELRISRTLQKLIKYPWLFNLVVNKANRNKTLHNTIIKMLNNTDVRKEFQNPLFYLRILFG